MRDLLKLLLPVTAIVLGIPFSSLFPTRGILGVVLAAIDAAIQVKSTAHSVVVGCGQSWKHEADSRAPLGRPDDEGRPLSGATVSTAVDSRYRIAKVFDE